MVQHEGSSGKLRQVYLPLEKVTECSKCKAKSPGGNFHICSSCGERAYCGTECQKEDWPNHKQNCGKTDRIAFDSFYPFIAWMIASIHASSQPVHFSLKHPIKSDINPTAHPVRCPDGWEAKLLVVDDTIPEDLEAWTPAVAFKMKRRIINSGFVLPIVTSVAVAILAEMYTTTSGANSKERRYRFKYKSSPIADFGIAHGSAKVTPQDRIAYYRTSDGSVVRDQDPDDHYWLYLKTARGEELSLDCAMFTFNMCQVVNTKGYIEGPNPLPDVIPAFLEERTMRKNAPSLHVERKRVSILRNTRFHDAIRHTEEVFQHSLLKPFIDMMGELSGRTITREEKDLFTFCCYQNSMNLANCLKRRSWERYPPSPSLGIEGDPGELDDLDDKSAAWYKRMEAAKKEEKRHQKGAQAQHRALE
ncbi:hypothetical protein C8Q75DRAFT_886665 [Abortiporus biennis]|nr:hypothetical protein C8Q75DRAFT_886665 [Abortiporus biennis]